MFEELERINRRPEPFATMTIRELWTDPHISERMLRYHLDDAAEGASRPAAFVDRSVAWIAEAFALGAGSRVLDLGCGPGQYTTRLARAPARRSPASTSRPDRSSTRASSPTGRGSPSGTSWRTIWSGNRPIGSTSRS
jgi:SAM-dependent methyltransferase